MTVFFTTQPNYSITSQLFEIISNEECGNMKNKELSCHSVTKIQKWLSIKLFEIFHFRFFFKASLSIGLDFWVSVVDKVEKQALKLEKTKKNCHSVTVSAYWNMLIYTYILIGIFQELIYYRIIIFILW